MNKNLLVGGLFLIVVITTVTVLLVRKGGEKITYAWSTSPVPDPGNTCSVPCGGGKRYLNVWCEAVDSTGKNVKIVDNSLCDQSTKPSEQEDCNTQACS